MYKNILVAIDPSHGPDQETALHVATQLADDPMSQITAITVLEPIPASVISEVPNDIAERAGALALADLRNVVGARSEVKTVLRHGKAGPTIVDYASENGIDCIVLASHKPGLSDYFLGSTASRVVRHAPCSVHVIR
ncbi:universal stress protein [Silicimonas sp. MF1-12-2]|uniref:universal stress protein n=1 Tax=Silicimonas sp. MF1-12-2 TaxID=3384793 RepID=UPI0039B3CB27